MRSLHVAALPFPTQQGTQAAIHTMLGALHEAGQAPQLLCYAHGAHVLAPTYVVHRLEHSLGNSSLRSGPSLHKLGLDLLLARKLRALVQAEKPQWVVAHHVEAALACVAAQLPRFVFVAHTSLREELRFYFPESLRGACDRVGEALDRLLCRKASHVLAISPLLAQELSQASGRHVHRLRLPWSLPRESAPDERALARSSLALDAHDEVILYAGNLDAYQGLPLLSASVRSLARERPRIRLLVATQAAKFELARLDLPTERVRHMPLADERDRRRAHAAADVVAVPRASAGGLPIKLLDALARGAQVVAVRRAAAGLALAAVCTLVEDDNPEALARALAARLNTSDRAAGSAARAYLQREHSNLAFLADFAAGLGLTKAECALPTRSFDEVFTRDGKVP